MVIVKTKRNTIIGVVFLALFLVGAYLSYSFLSGRYRPGEAVKVPEGTSTEEVKKIPAPDFIVFDADGKEFKLSDLRGKPVVLNFWASWCPPCRVEMPHFNEVYKEMKDKVSFMMVDQVDGMRETAESGRRYIEEQGFSFPVYYDIKQQAAIAYGIRSIPVTLFIDSDGNIAGGYQGAIEKETLIRGINKIKN